MTSTAGQRSTLVTTERTRMTQAEFAKGLLKLSGALDDQESTSMLVYGDSNAGKTWLAGTLPPNTGWLVCEPGYKSAVRLRAAKKLEPHRFARKITNSAEAWAAVEWLETGERYRKLEWLVLDGLSTMQDRFRLAYAAEAFDINPSKRAHRNLPDRPDYFNTQNFLKSWIPRLVDMPVNLLITAHAYRTDNTEDGELLVFPGVQGKVTETANSIAGLMDVTGYLANRRARTKEGSVQRRRLWLSSPSQSKEDAQEIRYIVGDKYNALGEYVDSPTMPKLMGMINGEMEK